MWTYNKMLEFPVKIKTTNPKLAMAIMSQLGGPDGEKGASTRYLSQRYAMKDKRIIGVLTDIGTEELNHEERWRRLSRSLRRICLCQKLRTPVSISITLIIR